MSNKHVFNNSTSIEHCDYIDDKDTMVIKFTSGAVYHYPDCSREHYEALKKAESPGKHFHQHIRSKKSVKVSG